ncbi:MAG: thiamine pyrophosphate-binding protein [Alphaproteobacteria bacterium]|nr:thiamine pyrophosphate-binding protein [Alphaproteobacteria bacterium]
MDGGTRVAEVLVAHGVRTLFTLVGGHISPILVAAKRLGIRVVDVRDEKNAVFAADAISRLSGIPGVAAVTAGPGVTNTITAIKNAQLAQVPLVVLGGATATMLRGRGSLQDIDQMALVEPHVKHAARPNRVRDVIPALEKAIRIARDGVPGPVFVELAVDLLYDEATVREWYARQTDKPDKNLVEHATSAYIKAHLAQLFMGTDDPAILPPRLVVPAEPSAKSVQQAAELLDGAARPVMVLGSQALLRTAQSAELIAAIERIGVPVYLSGMARGLLGTDHPLQLRHKRRAALKEADVVLLAGVPSDFRLDYGAHVSRCRVIGINLSREDLRKNRKPDVGIEADPHTSLVRIAAALRGSRERSGWMATLREREAARDAEIVTMAEEEVDGVNPIAFFRELDGFLGDDAILVGDGGDFVATCAYTVRPRGPLTWLDPGVFGTLGVGAGFAIGAKVARPDAEVWVIYGDGAAGFSIIEIDTMVRHGLPAILVIGNDGGWTQILRDQIVILEDDVACRLERIDYHVIAEGCGAKGILVREPSEIPDALAQARAWAREGHPVLVNVHIGTTDFRKGSISM